MQNGFLKTISIIYFALIAGQLMFIVVAFFSVSDNPPQNQDYDNFNIVVPIIVGSGLFLSNLIFKQLISKIKDNFTFQKKIEAYRSALIIKYALLEGPSIFSTAIFLISGNFMFLAFSAVMILAFLINFPSRNKAVQDLNLSSAEAEKL
jgi:hypothetical protein